MGTCVSTMLRSACKGARFALSMGEMMSEQEKNGSENDLGRRLFLEKAGRFAIVTPPAVVLMLSATGKARAQTTSGSTTTPSDRRLKTGIIRLATHPAGFGLYRFRYLWSDTEHIGVLAQEVLEVLPHAVVRGRDGYLRVNYAALGL